MILNARTTAQWIKKFRHIISLRKYSLFGPEALGASICGQCLFLCELLLYKVPGLALDALDWEAHWWALIRFLWKIRVEVGHYLNTPITVTTNCENTLERLIPQKLNYSIGIAASGRCMVIPPKVMKTLLYISIRIYYKSLGFHRNMFVYNAPNAWNSALISPRWSTTAL